MNFRSNGMRLIATRSTYDKVMNTVKFENIGYISKQNHTVNINEKFNASAQELESCSKEVGNLEKSQNLREELALLTLHDTVEQISRHLSREAASPQITELARKVLFHAEDLKRIARRHLDTPLQTPNEEI